MIRPVTALSGTLVVLALLVAPYLRPWISQRSEIDQGQAQVTQLRREVAALANERARWSDPAFVRAQARQRLHYVLPGETGYVILDDRPKAAATPRQGVTALAADSAGTDGVWYTRVWESIQLAGDPGITAGGPGSTVRGGSPGAPAPTATPDPLISILAPHPTTGAPGTPATSATTAPPRTATPTPLRTSSPTRSTATHPSTGTTPRASSPSPSPTRTR